MGFLSVMMPVPLTGIAALGKANATVVFAWLFVHQGRRSERSETARFLPDGGQPSECTSRPLDLAATAPLAQRPQLDRCRRPTRPDSVQTGDGNPAGPVWMQPIEQQEHPPMSIHSEYLVHTYIADRHREAQQRLPSSRRRDTSRQEVRRTKSTLPYGVDLTARRFPTPPKKVTTS
jgi:hypothetical protein